MPIRGRRTDNSGRWYGLTWNESTDAYARTGLLAPFAVGSTPGSALLPIQARMRRCVMSDAGVVRYYLNATDSTKKGDGSAAVLTGADGQVMVEIPQFYLRYAYAGNTHQWDVSELPLTGFSLHPAFLKNGVTVPARYIGAYEGVLQDVSAGLFANGLYQTAFSCTFAAADKSITAGSRTAPFVGLQAGDKIVISGTVSNNATRTIASVISGVKVTTTEAATDETAAATVIQTQKDFTATTGDKLASIAGKRPITMGTRAQFRAIAKNRGTGWRQLDYDLMIAVQLLYLVEYASFYSQSMIGAGITNVAGLDAYNDYNPIAPTGNSNPVGNATGNNAGSNSAATEVAKYLSYRGIENWFGHLWKFVDGININEHVPYVSNTEPFVDDTATDYANLGVTLGASDGWQATLAQISRGFLPLTVGAGSTSKITDYYYQAAGWRVRFSGGSSTSGAHAGAFGSDASTSSASADRSVSGRLAF